MVAWASNLDAALSVPGTELAIVPKENGTGGLLPPKLDSGAPKIFLAVLPSLLPGASEMFWFSPKENPNGCSAVDSIIFVNVGLD